MRLSPLLLTLAIALIWMPAATAQHAPGHHSSADHRMVEIIAIDYAFRAPGEIPSGWTTFRFTNEGNEEHFFVLLLLDEGWTFEDYALAVIPPVNEAWIAHRDGEMDYQEALGRITEMFEEGEIEVGYEYRGGSGILAPELSTDVTLYMEPGRYVLECYMKTEDGEFHLIEGMTRELIVLDQPSEATPPEAAIDITFVDGAMVMDGDLMPGRLTFRVTPGQGGDNVHIARMNADAGAQEIAEWTNWFTVDGLRHPAPATFVGGMHLLQPGTTGYFTADLEPGRYLFVRGIHGSVITPLKEVVISP